MSNHIILWDNTKEKIETLKLMLGLSNPTIIDRAVDLLIEKEIPEMYTPQQREMKDKKFKMNLENAEDNDFKIQSYIVSNAWADCMFRSYLSYSNNEEVPYVVIKHNVHHAQTLIRNVTFPELVPQLIKEYIELEKRCRDITVFNDAVKELLAYRKKRGIQLITPKSDLKW